MTERQADDTMGYMHKLQVVADQGIALIREKTKTYGPSWKQRGGQGAWFTTVRPWDRLEGIVRRHSGDIFEAIKAEPTGKDGSALACVRDLRNYLLLIEAEMVATGVVSSQTTPVCPICVDTGRVMAFDGSRQTTDICPGCCGKVSAAPLYRRDPRWKAWVLGRPLDTTLIGSSGNDDWFAFASKEGMIPHFMGNPCVWWRRVENTAEDKLLVDQMNRWAATLPNHNDERAEPGTPDDGGHHARQPVESAPEPSESGGATLLADSALSAALTALVRDGLGKVDPKIDVEILLIERLPMVRRRNDYRMTIRIGLPF